MKKIYILASLFLGFTFTSNAQLLLDENFDYGASAGDLVALSGGNWVNHNGTTTIQYQTTSLSMTGYPSTGVGGSALVDGSRSEDAHRAFTNQTSGVIYASALINVASAAATENYFLHFQSGTTIFYARVHGKDDGSGNLNLGIVETNTGTINFSTTSYSYNTTYLVVIKYDFTAGAASLFVLNAVTGTEPTANAVSSDGTNATALDKIGLRQSAGIPITTVDGIRVANTWADLMSAPSSPTVMFATSTQSANEADGTVAVNLSINPAPAGNETVTISILGTGTATYGGDYSTTPNGATSTFNVPVTAGATSVSFNVTINDDATVEGNETIEFEISAVSAGLTIGSTSTNTFTIVDNDYTQIPIKDVQFTTGGDLSDLEGQTVKVGGIVTGVVSTKGFFIQDNAGSWNGIYVFDNGANTVARGDSVIFIAEVYENFNQTQLINVSSFVLESSGNAVYAPVSLSTNAVNAEEYESVLVTVTNADVTVDINGFAEWEVSDGSGNVMVDDLMYLTTPTPTLGETYMITGPVAYTFSRFKIEPRDANDVTEILSVSELNSVEFSIYPNPSNGIVNVDVKGNATIEVYNSLGQMVLNTTSKTFELPSGVYSVRVKTNNGTASKNIIIK